MLNEIVIKERFLVENKKVYAFAEGLANPKRIVNGCEARQELKKSIDEKLLQKQAKEKELAEINKELATLQKVDNEIAALGYCPIDAPVYKKIDGVVIKDRNNNPIIAGHTHNENCLRGK